MFKDVIMALLSFAILAGYFITSGAILEGKISTDNPNVLLLIGSVAGAWATMAGIVISYWFGTTKTSAEKDKTINDMKTQTVSATVTPETAKVTSGPQQPNPGA